jgi:ornithine cyclodeaminase/alanine dehydrogenase-like protein (mu-crystallin family)
MSGRQGGQYHIKACVLDEPNVAGFRLVGHQAEESDGRATRWVILLDAATSMPLAIVDETWNYAQRTVAVMAVAARRLATDLPRTKGNVLAVIGAGRLASAALTYYKHLFDLGEVRIASRREETRTRLAALARDRLDLPALAASSIEAAVRGADQILTCTSSGQALLSENWISPGAVVSCLDTAEPGPGLLGQADLLVVDSREQLEEELIEGYGPGAPALVDTTIAEVVSGRHPGRAHSQERVLVISQGLASLDVALAAEAFELAQE